jgi:hypothetical protein
MNVNVIVLIGQFILAAVLVWIAVKKLPIEHRNLDADAAEKYAQAAKIKGEENDKLEREMEELRQSDRKEIQELRDLVTRKKFRITVVFTVGEPVEPGMVTVEPIFDVPKPDIKDMEKTKPLKR